LCQSQTTPTPPVAASAKPTIPLCTDLPQVQLAAKSKYATPVVSYVDATIRQLQAYAPQLNQLQLVPGETLDTPASTTPSTITTELLKKTSNGVIAMARKIPNLLAKEMVAPAIYRQNSPRALVDTYSFRIQPVSTATGVELTESRVDTWGNTVDATSGPSVTGHSLGWFYFYPGNYQKSRFRYLGRQKIGNQQTYVLAFAQDPTKASLGTNIISKSVTCSSYLQGVAWIDPNTFGIVRLQTDLLMPLDGIELKQLRTTLNFSPIYIASKNLTLLMPRQIDTVWHFTNGAIGREQHVYSNYRLFGVTTTIVYGGLKK